MMSSEIVSFRTRYAFVWKSPVRICDRLIMSSEILLVLFVYKSISTTSSTNATSPYLCALLFVYIKHSSYLLGVLISTRSTSTYFTT
jgi:hypothetical protein